MNAYVIEIQKEFERYKDETKAGPMTKYMRDQFPFLGISSPERKQLAKVFFQQVGLPEIQQLEEVLDALWELPEREFQYVGLMLLDKLQHGIGLEQMPFLEQLIVRKSWWDTVDYLAPYGVGGILLRYPEAIADWNAKWIKSDNIWLQRTAIIFQLRYKDQTDAELLFSNILRRRDSKEFFVQKAMGWALREYSKVRSEEVKEFIDENADTLPPLTKREWLRVLMRKKMV